MSFDAGRALVIGVGTYQEPRLTAAVTAADADAIAAALVDPAVAGYPEDRVVVIHDHAATRVGIGDALDRLQAAAATDTVVVFYAGHGLLDLAGEYNLTAHDSQLAPDGLHVVTGTGIPESVLLAKLRAIPAEKVLLIVNACFSGNVKALGPTGSTTMRSLGAPPSENLATRVLATGEGRAILTACRATQESWYLPGSTLTVFGGAVEQGLRGQGRVPNAAYIGIWDFYQYVFDTTRAQAGKIPEVQEPVMNLGSVVGAFPIALAGPPPAAALGAVAPILGDAPAGTAANLVAPDVIDAARSFTPGSDVAGVSFGAGPQVVDNRKLLDLTGAVIGNLTIGDVAGGDMIKIQLGATPAAAAAASSAGDLRATIESVRSSVALLQGVDDERSDVVRDLDDAAAAATDGKVERVRVKLDRARAQLQALGPLAPAAVPLSETLAVLMQRARDVAG